MRDVALLGRAGPLPFAGHFAGELPLPGGRACWAGRVAGDADVEVAWRAVRAVQRALRLGGPLGVDRRRALAILWDRLSAVRPDALGPRRGADLAVLLVARDAEGVSVSAVGVDTVFAVGPEHRAAAWVTAPHPLLGAAGLPRERPGALSVDSAPPWLVGVVGDDTARVEGLSLGDVLPACGVHR